MKTIREYNKKTFLGIANDEKIYLSAPSWDCGWYWGFGYLGNKNCHYHVSGLMEKKDLHNGFIEHFGKSFIVRKSDIWTLAELFKTFYVLKETAEILGRGGAHYTTNPCADIIKNTDEVKRINEVVMPAIFDQIYMLLERNADNTSLFNKLVKINLQGDTKKVVDFMFAMGLHTDDLESIEQLTKHDISVIHTAYWRSVHKK